MEWQKTFGTVLEEKTNSIIQSGDGGYIAGGFISSFGSGSDDILVLKLSPNGTTGPSCKFLKDSDGEVLDTSVSPLDTAIVPREQGILYGFDYQNLYVDVAEARVYQLCSEKPLLSILASSGGTTEPAPGTSVHEFDEEVMIKAISESGHRFSEWSGDVSATNNPITITLNSSKSITASFAKIIEKNVFDNIFRIATCTIATAAYGSPLHPWVKVLRDFRDKYLLSSKVGQLFVKTYYRHSPRFARIIAKHNALRVAVQISLVPLVGFGYLMVHFGKVMTAVIFAFLLAAPIFSFKSLRKKTIRGLQRVLASSSGNQKRKSQKNN